MYSSSMIVHRGVAAEAEVGRPVLTLEVSGDGGRTVVSQQRTNQHPVAFLCDFSAKTTETKIRMERRVTTGALDVLMSD